MGMRRFALMLTLSLTGVLTSLAVVHAGTTTGRVFDQASGALVTCETVKIEAFAGADLTKAIATSQTDANGNFSISYKNDTMATDKSVVLIVTRTNVAGATKSTTVSGIFRNSGKTQVVDVTVGAP